MVQREEIHTLIGSLQDFLSEQEVKPQVVLSEEMVHDAVVLMLRDPSAQAAIFGKPQDPAKMSVLATRMAPHLYETLASRLANSGADIVNIKVFGSAWAAFSKDVERILDCILGDEPLSKMRHLYGERWRDKASGMRQRLELLRSRFEGL